jgi:hypothetical protein
MFEFFAVLMALSVLTLASLLVIGTVKLVVGIALLPLRLGWWLLQGVVGLTLFVLLLALLLPLVTLLPILAVLVGIPLLILAGIWALCSV